jgi:hypothetical protein
MTLYQRSAMVSCSTGIPEFCIQGDLSELLGEVPVYKPKRPNDPLPISIPPLPTDGKHPYHLVVMYVTSFPAATQKSDMFSSAGQECPTSSGAIYSLRTRVSAAPESWLL